jgi:3-oxoacyl-[acyl-carrier-protein] synthase-3
MSHIQIKAVDIYHPQKSVNNDFYFDHFKKQGKEIEHFIVDIMGRNNRYVIDHPTENSLTMAIEASKKVIEKANLQVEDIDMIIFSTQTPEHTFPSNAMLLHKELGAHNKTISYDSNSNCAGMTVAVEQLSRYMQANPRIKYGLVVGSDHNTVHCDPNCEITYANYGDASAAVILERVEEPTGFIDARYTSETSGCRNILAPAVGTSNLFKDDISLEDLYIKWIPFDGTVVVEPAVDDMHDLLNEHGLTLNDINAFCLSQFSIKNIEMIQQKLEVDIDKFIYVGDEFGYTGTSSPFIALYKGIESGKIKRGDHVLFWTVGTGWQIISMLFKY